VGKRYERIDMEFKLENLWKDIHEAQRIRIRLVRLYYRLFRQ